MRAGTIKWVIFAVTSLGNFIGMLDFSSVNIALYKISQAFGLSVSAVQWIMLSYQIILTSLLTFFGRLGDMVNRRKLYTCGFLIFGTGACLSYFSINFCMLLFARTVQGLGGSILISNSFSIVSSVFKGRRRGKALGFMGAVTHLAGMTAPSISGFLMEVFSWRAIFLPSCLISFLGVFLAVRVIPAGYKLKKAPIDVKGTVFLMAGVASLLFMIAESPAWGIVSAQTGGAVLLVVFCLFLFVRHENRTKAPRVSFNLFVVLWRFCKVRCPLNLKWMANGSLCGLVSPQKRMIAGMILLGAGLFLFSRTGLSTPAAALVLMQIVMGVGNAFFQPSVNTAILNATPKDSTGMASGILSLFRNTGIAMGSVISVGIFETYKNYLTEQGNTEKEALLSSYHFALYCGIGFAFLCLIFIIKSIRLQKNKPKEMSA